MTELLAPAGNIERLKWAVEYGADAVYFGIHQFSLRSFAGNFSIDEVDEGIKYLHDRGRKGYVTLNAYPFSNEFPNLTSSARILDEIGVDAFIVADLGVLSELASLNLNAALHISTQANTVNFQSALAYRNLGARRVNLARELSIDQIVDIQNHLKNSDVETEVFIHGSVCFSQSGRCAISDYLTGRRANRGECTHPCRWKYSLVEEKRPDLSLPIMEDERGAYIFNTKDLALFPYVHSLVDAGVASLKIEGRMKNAHYLASVLPVYRAFLDGRGMDSEEAWKRLGRVDNRSFSFGFMKGSIDHEDYETTTDKYKSTSVWIAATTEELTDGMRVCRVKNTIHAGESLELLTPDGSISQFVAPNPIITITGERVGRANNQDTIVLDAGIPSYSILRRVTEGS